MIVVIQEGSAHGGLRGLTEFYQLRRQVFVEQYGWSLTVDAEGREVDEFDTEEAEYILDVADNGRLQGGLRLLATEQPHLLSKHFAHLCEGVIPRGKDVREISRFATDPDLPRDQCMRVRHRLASALVEYGLLYGLRTYTLVTHTSWLSTLLSVGWACHPLGLPVLSDGQSVGALAIEVSPEGLAALRSFGGRYPVLTLHAEALVA